MRRLSVRAKLLGIAGLGAVLAVAVATVGVTGLSNLDKALDEQVVLTEALGLHQDVDGMHDALRSNVYVALSATRTNKLSENYAETGQNVTRLKRGIAELRRLQLPPSLRRQFEGLNPRLIAYAASVRRIVEAAGASRAAARDMLDPLEETYVRLTDEQDIVTSSLTSYVKSAREAAHKTRSTTVRQLVVAGILAVVALLALSALVGRSIIHALKRLRDMSADVASGKLSVRASVQGRDELAELAHSLNEMAASLERVVNTMAGEARQQAFRRDLKQALEMAENEDTASDLVGRALAELTTELPGELLLADSSRAHFRRAGENVSAGAAGCPVASPLECVAVRRGGTSVFASGADLTSCPKLRDRPDGPRAGACAPVSFMGQSLGVLHVSAPEGEPPPTEVVEQLTFVANEFGTRIGTIRAFAQTKRQASTDGLTGLLNRRSFDDRLRALGTEDTPFAVVMADLDRFKQLNDTYGHEAGDRALRLFAKVLTSTLRSSDIVARYGGEEFVIVFPGLCSSEVLPLLERLRFALSSTLATSDAPTYTASFGVADSTNAPNPTAVVATADAALLAAKAAGRDCVIVAGDGPRADDPLRERLSA